MTDPDDAWLDRLDRGALVDSARDLSDALDRMWNDPYRHNRDNWNGHARRISNAQAEMMKLVQGVADDRA